MAKYKGRYDKGWEVMRKARYERQLKMGLIDKKWKLSPRDGMAWKDAPNKEWEIRLMETYAAMVDRLDQGLGRVIGALEKRKMLDDTLILFLADNGGCAEGMGRRQGIQYKDKDPDQLKPMKPTDLQTDMIPRRTREGVVLKQGTEVMTGGADTYHGYGLSWANASNTPFRQYKHWVHEGGISAPLVAHWPSGIDEKLNGKMDSQPAHLIDLMATCADLGKATYPEKIKGQAIVPLQGVSIAPAFTGKKIARKKPIFWEHEGNRAIRIGKWKLVAKGSKGPWELYDLEQDRTELNDLSGKHGDRAKEMADLWEAWAIEAKAKPWPWGGSPKKKGSKKKAFNLSGEDQLDMENAPMIANKAFEVEAHYQGDGDGVLVAQGGDAHGWVLYVEDDRLHFGVCRNGKFSFVKASSAIESKTRKVLVRFDKNGEVEFLEGERSLGEGKLAGLVAQMPVDGLHVGRDEYGTVGVYKNAFRFPGEVKKIRIKIN